MGLSSCDNDEVAAMYKKLNGKWVVESCIQTVSLNDSVSERDIIKEDEVEISMYFMNDTTLIEVSSQSEDITEATYQYIPEHKKLIVSYKNNSYGYRRALLGSSYGSQIYKVDFVDENTCKLSNSYSVSMPPYQAYYELGFDKFTEEQYYSEEYLTFDIKEELTLKRITE